MIDGSNHMLDVNPQDYISALAAYHCANWIIAFRDVDVRQLLKEVAERDKRIIELEKKIQQWQDNYTELEELYDELKYESGF